MFMHVQVERLLITDHVYPATIANSLNFLIAKAPKQASQGKIYIALAMRRTGQNC
jgi:hypothetical protein